MADEPQLTEEVVALDETTPEKHLAEYWSEYWSVVTKRWRLIALCLGMAFMAAALYCLLTRPLYQAVAILDVEPERATALDISISVPISNSFFAGPEFLATQARLMETLEIAERVAKRLNLAENQTFNPPKGGFFRRARKLKAEEALAGAAAKVKGGINAKPIRETNRDTNLVELSAIAPSRELAAAIANATADAYIERNQESKYGVSGRASGYLAEQIQQVKGELDAKEQQLLTYGKEKEILSTDSQGSPGSQSGLYYQRQELNYDSAVAERAAKEARYRDVQSARPESLADTLAGGLVFQLRSEQAKLERDYAERLTLFKPDWPAMRQLKAQIDNGRERLETVIAETVAKVREAAKNDYLNALRREQSLKAAMNSQKNETMRLNTDIVEYNNLKLEVNTKRSLLNELLKRQAEVDMASRLGRAHESNIRVAEKARPPDAPFRPSYLRSGLLALLLGGGLGVGLAILLEYLDRSLRTVEQVEQHVQLPALGVIPAVGAESGKSYGYFYSGKSRKKGQSAEEDEVASIELLPHQHPRSRVAERYRAFRTALLLSRAGGVKSIVITSSVSQEGKTATAVNLAVVLGQLGKRVLLVDADLHRPRLHEIFRVSNRAGLVSILAENLNPDRAIANTGVPDVFVVPSGPSSPNPSGLLSSEAMSNFLEFARKNFDYVILDAPPVTAVADALVLGHQTDGVVLCVKGGATPRDQVARVRDRLLRSNVRILGVLINNLVETAGEYAALSYDESYYGETTGHGREQRAASAAHAG